MGIINILDAQTANMIAAGEVVDRPASALKELLENAVDAGATSVSIEIKGGGTAFIRITDNGSGFARDDMPKALLRHATSKIKTGDDLDGIMTLGFRGEALAAISSVSRIEIISKRKNDELGTRLTSDENGIIMVDTGCPSGTTVIVRDLFYNIPARYKFLKRDSSEAAAAAAVAERIALSHPEVSFSFISEGERKFFTPGDSKLLSAIYAVYGRDFANGLKEIEYEADGVRASGFITKPDSARGSRNLQIFYVNGRFVRSKTVMAALEEAFKSYLPHGKYPAGIINLTLNVKNTDVNVHPAKLEIKFTDERKIFEVVYYGVKNMLTQPEKLIAQLEKVPEKNEPVINIQNEQQKINFGAPIPKKTDGVIIGYEVFKPSLGEEDLPLIDLSTDSIMTLKSPEITEEEAIEHNKNNELELFTDEKNYKIIGEAYNAFIFVEIADRVLVIDKHAAHERVLYEELNNKKEMVTQQLLEGILLTLPREQTNILLDNLDYLNDYGFIAELFGNDTIIIRSVPAALSELSDLQSLFESFAAKLIEGNALSFAERCDRALFTIACKAAMKAGQKNNIIHNEWLIDRLLLGGDIHYCPHGRPVIKEISKREIEKYFDR
ncbi:MAG: hypothetical protein A2Y15_01165 [Clostridiales bacterium GWF2_36_10]|nr:MAG: hypothetical protein A2Y15_01165 [Clostridiales bacterium GWF2_36_10]